MCGITGLAVEGAIDASGIVAACSAISHRGPDDAGVKVWPERGVGLGHRRLSIIDLSPAGHNPMSNEDGTIWIVYNGEIYNFRNLRQELERLGHVFRSNTDTEVVIHAYEQWGDDHVHRLRGMFAYALCDFRPQSPAGVEKRKRQCRFLLVRDRLGIKPLCYYWDGRSFIFASEIKAILAYPGVDRTVDRSALFDYLTYWYVPTPKTAYKHVRKLPPGHCLVFDGRDVRTRRYWDLDLHRSSPVTTESEALESVQKDLEDAVRLHMVSDVPVGVFLSGGLDSSTVTALMSRLSNDPVHTFSVDFDVAEHSEIAFARLVAQRYHTRHCERTVAVDSIKTMLPMLVRLYGEPFADGSAIPTHRVSECAREHVKVALSGDGGDEVFWGYNWYSAWLRRQSASSAIPDVFRPLFRFARRCWPPGWKGQGLMADLGTSPMEQYARRLEMFSPDQKRRIASDEWGREFTDYDDYWYFRQFWREDVDPITRVQYLDLKTYLVDDILTKVDRASMAVSLEVRPALLDHVLVEKVFSLPAALRAPSGEKKHLLKQIAGNLLPAAIIDRPKKGFSAPWTRWFQSEREWVQETLGTGNDGAWLNAKVFGSPWIADRGPRLLGVLVLQEWLGRERDNTG